jgi:hypothetical protein
LELWHFQGPLNPKNPTWTSLQYNYLYLLPYQIFNNWSEITHHKLQDDLFQRQGLQDMWKWFLRSRICPNKSNACCTFCIRNRFIKLKVACLKKTNTTVTSLYKMS